MKMCLRLRDSLLPHGVLDAEWQEIEARFDRLEKGIRELQATYRIETDRDKWAWNGPEKLPPVTSANELYGRGMKLLHAANDAAHPSTELTDAAENFHAAYAAARSNTDRADAIAHCGISIWFALLAFFRRGARANLKAPKCGAPEEIFLILALKPADHPGGPTGSRLRSAIGFVALPHLQECLRSALWCFQRAVELGRPALGLQWQIHVQRSTGNFAECRRIAASSSTVVDADEQRRLDTYVKGIESFQADLAGLAVAACTAAIPSGEWLHPEILTSMAAACMQLKKAAAPKQVGDAFRIRKSAE